MERRFVIDALSIANGVFSPLTGFMNKEDVNSVLHKMYLADGEIPWAIPIILPLSGSGNLPAAGERLLLMYGDTPFGWLDVEEVFILDIEEFVEKVFQTKDDRHPGVAFWRRFVDSYFVGGNILVFADPLDPPVDRRYLLTPAEVRKRFQKLGWKKIAAFQTRNPIHRAHEYLIKCAIEVMDGVLIHPLVGETKQDDIPADIRMRCYEVLIENYFEEKYVFLSALYANMYYAGPREAVHHMIVRKNFGCTHMIIGRDHAGVGNFYGSYEAQQWAKKWADAVEVEPITFEHAFYCYRCDGMATLKTCPHSEKDRVILSGTELRRRLRENEDIPPQFSRPEVIQILKSWVAQLKPA